MKEMGREGGQAEKFDRIQVFMGVFFLSFQLFDLGIIKNSNKERRRGSGRGEGRKVTLQTDEMIPTENPSNERVNIPDKYATDKLDMELKRMEGGRDRE